MSSPLLIGQAPGPNTDPELPLYPIPRTSAGGRLRELTGLTRGEYLRYFDRINLLPYFPGRVGHDDSFPMTPAKLAARVIRPLLTGRIVILVGRKVADAFKIDLPFHEWAELRTQRPNILTRCRGTARFAIVPHPSGRNHWYNRDDNRRLAHCFWQELESWEK